MRHLVELNFLVTDGGTGELLASPAFEKHIDDFSEYLADAAEGSDDIADVTVDATLTQGRVHVEMWVEASSEAEAVDDCYIFVIPAILAVGGFLSGLNHPALRTKRERWENLPTAA